MGGGVTTVMIRRLTLEDLETVVAMEAANRPAPWTEGVFRDELAAENRIYLAADEDGVVGWGGLMLVGDEAHVTNLLVDPEWRRRGIGLELMLALIEAAVSEGARHLTLEVRSKNEEARRLYARLGLAPVGVRREYYGDDDALILWVHDIDGEAYRERLEGLR
ncbi:MAG TPA: ribosomal protein S18-alanine N-acetyltransferase [Acidimicrobiia bacterium]|nr:ribosomal protein S18-alanine N-acetyltransferase [Acidimicrobiia bacterium]